MKIVFRILGTALIALLAITTLDAAPAIGQTEPVQSADTLQEVRARAELAWAAGDLEAATESYEMVLRLAPGDEVALFRLALVNGWEGRTDAALDYFDRLIEARPDNAEARVARARVLAWAGREGEAVEALNTLLAERPGYLPALEARATFLAWSGRYDQALAVWDSLVVADPQDASARRGRAAARTFAGDIDGAEADYIVVLDANPADVEALRGLARARSWDGRLVEGETGFRRALAEDEDDVATLVALAQNLRWQGRNATALEVLRRAEALSPGNADLREELHWVEMAVRPRTSLTYAAERDSDDNDMRTVALTARFNPVPRLAVRADAYQRDADAPGLDRQAVGVSLAGTWQFEPGWDLTLRGGVSENDGSGDTAIPSWGLAVSSPRRHPVRVTLDAGASALDATAALAERGVEVRQVSLNVSWTRSSGLLVSGSAGAASIRGSESNRRLDGSIVVQRPIATQWTVGLTGRAFGFEKDLFDGYFDPDEFLMGEALLRWSWEPTAWSVSLEAAPGVQRIGSDGGASGVFRTTGRLAWRVRPGREVWVSGGWSSAGLQQVTSTGGTDYRYAAVSTGVSWVF